MAAVPEHSLVAVVLKTGQSTRQEALSVGRCASASERGSTAQNLVCNRGLVAAAPPADSPQRMSQNPKEAEAYWHLLCTDGNHTQVMPLACL